MKKAMQLKAIIKNIAKEKNISAQLVLQNFMLERLLERIAISKYHDYFILKGGFLIAAIVGLDTRATMDMDLTIKGIQVTKDSIKNIFIEICEISMNDDIEFIFENIGDIREDDEYSGYRISLTANFQPMKIPLKLDITKGDKITPREINYKYKLLMENRTINVLAYNLETVLSEKLETIISRGDQNTRPRDFYDVYICTKLQSRNIDYKILKKALLSTSEKRGTENIMGDYISIIEIIRESTIMQEHWERYQKSFDYAKGVSFTDACISVIELMKMIND